MRASLVFIAVLTSDHDSSLRDAVRSSWVGSLKGYREVEYKFVGWASESLERERAAFGDVITAQR